MNIETKFNLGELVVPIRQRSESISEPCPECEGTGSVALLKGGAAPCQSRECRWGKINARVIHPWTPCTDLISAIGKVEVERYAKGFCGEDRTTYMIEMTGIGSGSIWYERDLFATVMEAQHECDLRNAAASVTASAAA